MLQNCFGIRFQVLLIFRFVSLIQSKLTAGAKSRCPPVTTTQFYNRMIEMLEGDIKPGDELLFAHGNGEIAQLRVISVLVMHGEKVIIVSINNEPPVHIDEDLLRSQCVRQEKATG
jgi:hypothetical protein